MIKRLFDIIASFIGLIMLSPLLISIMLIIKIGSKGPIFFCQNRVGRYGRLFTIYKFRTMIKNHYGNSVSISGQDRITTIGRFLRKYKLDELPELWNVLKGDMSFVGPRPDVPDYINTLNNEERCFLELRPGITSPASIKYVSEEDILANIAEPQKYYDEIIWPDKVKINIEYFYNHSFVKDIQIIFRTFFK